MLTILLWIAAVHVVCLVIFLILAKGAPIIEDDEAPLADLSDQGLEHDDDAAGGKRGTSKSDDSDRTL